MVQNESVGMRRILRIQDDHGFDHAQALASTRRLSACGPVVASAAVLGASDFAGGSGAAKPVALQGHAVFLPDHPISRFEIGTPGQRMVIASKPMGMLASIQ